MKLIVMNESRRIGQNSSVSSFRLFFLLNLPMWLKSISKLFRIFAFQCAQHFQNSISHPTIAMWKQKHKFGFHYLNWRNKLNSIQNNTAHFNPMIFHCQAFPVNAECVLNMNKLNGDILIWANIVCVITLWQYGRIRQQCYTICLQSSICCQSLGYIDEMIASNRK